MKQHPLDRSIERGLTKLMCFAGVGLLGIVITLVIALIKLFQNS